MAKIENHKYSVGEAFEQCFFVVPDYQREYVWETKQVRQLLEDIDGQLNGGTSGEYFIGTVLVSPTPDETRNRYDVIDGQQRLTTLFLLLCAIKHLLKNEPQIQQIINKSIIDSRVTSQLEVQQNLKLETHYENSLQVMKVIADSDERPGALHQILKSKNINVFGSLGNLLNAYQDIYNFLEEHYQSTDELKKYWLYLNEHVVWIQIATEVSNALKIFETINNRGIGLNPMDLLKNLLFVRVKSAEFLQLKKDWKSITSALEKKKEKPLRFLRYFLMANYEIKNVNRDHIIREDEIYTWLNDNARLCGYESNPFDFVRKIEGNVDHYINFSNSLGNDGKENIAMQNLRKLSQDNFRQHYVLLLAAADLPKPLFDHLVTQIEIFLFYYIFTNTPTRNLEHDFSLWADELRIIAKELNIKTQRAALNKFLQERFGKDIDSKQANLEDALKRYAMDATSKKRRTRYLLAKLSQFVDMAFKGQKGINALNCYYTAQIEHILPDTPSPALKKDFDAKHPACDYFKCKSKLGNLTLLEKPINIVASNNFFDNKKKLYEESSYYLTRSLVDLAQVGVNSSITRINRELKSFKTWTPDDIDERQKMLVELAKQVWKVELLSLV